MQRIRDPVVAGQFYESNPKKLRERIEWCFTHHLGPRLLPEEPPSDTRNLIAAQVPHAGYIYSGPAAAHVYYAIYQDGKPDTFIIIGPNHTGLGMPVSIYAKGAWKTPLGIVEIDEKLASKLLKYDIIHEDYLAHSGEHSIEVQLPFLQYLFGSDFKIVPITMMDQTYETSKKVAEAILEEIKNYDRRVIVLASSDMTHYEPHSIASKKDMEALSFIENLQIEDFYRYVMKTNLSMCGYGPVMVAMFVARYFGATGLVLKYYTSGEISGEKSWVVGYAAVIFGRGLIKPIKKGNMIKEAVTPL